MGYIKYCISATALIQYLGISTTTAAAAAHHQQQQQRSNCAGRFGLYAPKTKLRKEN